MSSLAPVAVLVRGSARDIDAVDAVMRAAFDPAYGEAWTPAQTLGMLSLPGVWLTIAEADGGAVGFTLTRAIGGDAELLLLAVIPERRGTGIGRALLRAAMSEAVARGSPQLCLEMRANNPATRLYLGEGFVKRGERRDYYVGRTGERYDAHTYIWSAIA